MAELKTYSFTQEDINLITFALRQLSSNTGFSNIKDDAENLIEFTERQYKEYYPDASLLTNKEAKQINTFLKSKN